MFIFNFLRWSRRDVGLHQLHGACSNVQLLLDIDSAAGMGEDMVEKVHHTNANCKYFCVHYNMFEVTLKSKL